MADSKKGGEEANIQKLEAIASPNNFVPKICTHISFGVTKEKNVIITLNYQEGKQNILIERVAVEFDHAKKISDVLKGLIEKVEKDGTNISKTE